MKVFLKITGALVIIAILLLFLVIQRVDYTPYFETGYYKITKERLDSLTKELGNYKGKVYIGFGIESITPVLNSDRDDPETGKFVRIPLAGYGGRQGAPATGIHDSLYVKSVAVRVGDRIIVLVGADLLIMPPEVSQQATKHISKSSGLERGDLFFSATHTHSSVGAWSGGKVGEMFGGAYNPNVVNWLTKRVAKSIEEAVSDLKPGKLGVGNFDGKGYVSNRLVGEDGLVDADFIFVVAEQDKGKKGIIGAFNAHATTLGDWNMETSGDYPGYWQRKLEDEGFDVAVFHAGSVGSHTYRSHGDKFEKSKYIGEALADSVLKYSALVSLSDTITLSAITLKVEIPEFQVRISDGLRLNPSLARKLFPKIGEVYLQVLRISDLIWATTPSDFSGETAITFKNAMHKRGFYALVSSFNGAYTGYIIPCKYYHLDAYESRLMNWFGPAYNPYINYLTGTMMNEISVKH